MLTSEWCPPQHLTMATAMASSSTAHDGVLLNRSRWPQRSAFSERAVLQPPDRPRHHRKRTRDFGSESIWGRPSFNSRGKKTGAWFRSVWIYGSLLTRVMLVSRMTCRGWPKVVLCHMQAIKGKPTYKYVQRVEVSRPRLDPLDKLTRISTCLLNETVELGSI